MITFFNKFCYSDDNKNFSVDQPTAQLHLYQLPPERDLSLEFTIDGIIEKHLN